MRGCMMPMSSPMMKRMLGFVVAAAADVFSCATAGAGVAIAAKARGTTVAKMIILLSWILRDFGMGTSCDEVPPVQVRSSARVLSQSMWQKKPEVSALSASPLCPLLAQSRHAQCADECPLLGATRTLTNRCLPISIYEYTA